jgi:uncharacterized protein YkwD
MGRGSRSEWLFLALAGLAVAAVGVLVPSLSVSRTSAQTVGRPAASLSLAAGQQFLLHSEEQAFVALINEYRAKNGVPSLNLSPTLNSAARWMSEDMAANDHFDHTDSLGRNLFQRMADFGYGYDTWKGENLAAGSASVTYTFELWRDSPAHNGNMLNRDFVVIGVARAYDPDSTHGWYWTTDFGGFDDEFTDLDLTFDEELQESTPLRGAGTAELMGTVSLVDGWNHVCYAESQQGINAALAPIMNRVLAVYRLRDDGSYGRWFAGRPEASTITTLNPYDQLFVLMSEAGIWQQERSTQTQASVNLVRGWNGVCYTAQTKPVEDATAGIDGTFAVLYMLADDQTWIKYVPGGPDLSDIAELKMCDSVLVLVTEPGGSTWTFDP